MGLFHSYLTVLLGGVHFSHMSLFGIAILVKRIEFSALLEEVINDI